MSGRSVLHCSVLHDASANGVFGHGKGDMGGLRACAPLHDCTCRNDRHLGHGVSCEQSVSASKDLKHFDILYIVHSITLLSAER